MEARGNASPLLAGFPSACSSISLGYTKNIDNASTRSSSRLEPQQEELQTDRVMFPGRTVLEFHFEPTQRHRLHTALVADDLIQNIFWGKSNADGETRTRKAKPHAPQTCAYTNSATSAGCITELNDQVDVSYPII
jgi:hypothetical protein